MFRRLARVVLTTVKAIIICHCQRAAPHLATVFEIAALAGPLIKTDSSSGQAASSSASSASDSLSDSSAPTTPAAPAAAAAARPRNGGRHSRTGPAAIAQLVLTCSLRLARGWAPAVVVAQGVRLIGSLVQKRDQQDGGKREGTEVRALQLGLSVVPRVDPRVSRSLHDYSIIYREWLLLLRGRLAQTGLELPDLFDEGPEGDEELMRFALCYNLLQARSLKDALVAMDRTISNIRAFTLWHSRYSFIDSADLEAWQRIAWWEGPDPDGGHLWLMIDFRAAVQASRTHGTDTVAQVLVSNVEYGVRQLIPDLGCAATIRVVVDASGVHIGGAMRSRGVFMMVGRILDRMYPCRLQLLYLVGLPFPMRWTFKAALQLLSVHTRRKIRMCRATDVPRRLPSQLRSHKLSVGAGLDGLALETVSFYEGGTGGSMVELGSDVGEPFTPAHTRAAGAGSGVTGPGRRRMFSRWRRGGGAGAVQGKSSAGAASRRWGTRRQLAAALVVVALLAGVLLLLGVYVVLLLRVAPESSRMLFEQTTDAINELLAAAPGVAAAAAAVG